MLQGNSATDGTSLASHFAEAASSALRPTLSAAKLSTPSPVPPSATTSRLTPSARARTLLRGDGRVDNVDARAELPRVRWPKEWAKEGLRLPVAQLSPALRSRPLSGVRWERQCQKAT